MALAVGSLQTSNQSYNPAPMNTPTFFWHDYETFGTDPQRDRVCQFAGIRTDAEFNPIAEPIISYCAPSPDYLPHPEACLITGITPQVARQHGVCEAEFTGIIHEQFAQPETCALGYNSIRFDDEVSRNLLYRNFYDPYAREWQNNNSRWDLIDIVRAARALRPEGIVWPLDEAGVASFRLEALSKANHIAHEAAHDALSDVYATIAIAKLIKQRQPKLFNYLFAQRSKTAAQQLLQVGSYTPLVHISGRFPARKHCLAIILPLCRHPTNANEVVVFDLAADPTALLELSAAEIQQRVFTASSDLAEGIERIPLKTVHINKCPVLAPLSVIRPADAERLELDIPVCLRHAEQLRATTDLESKLAAVFKREYADSPSDPDLMIYSGGFFSSRDKNTLSRIRSLSPQQLKTFNSGFDDPRLAEMLFRYRGRNFPETLSTAELADWQGFCFERLHQPPDTRYLNFDEYFSKIQALQADPANSKGGLSQLQEYGVALQKHCAA